MSKSKYDAALSQLREELATGNYNGYMLDAAVYAALKAINGRARMDDGVHVFNCTLYPKEPRNEQR